MDLIAVPSFAVVVSESQRETVTSSRSHSRLEAGLKRKSRSPLPPEERVGEPYMSLTEAALGIRVSD